MVEVLRSRRDDRGAILPLIGLCLAVLMVSTAFAVDLGREAAENRRLQSLADSAALDGARELRGGNQKYSAVYTKVYNAAMANAAKNSVSSPESIQSVEVGSWDPLTQVFTPVTNDFGGTVSAVRVTAHADFNNLFNVGSQSLSRAAVANANGLVGQPNNQCGSSTKTYTYGDVDVDVGSTTVRSAGADFLAGDAGASVSGPEIPSGTKIVSVASSTQVTISAGATASKNPTTFVVYRIASIPCPIGGGTTTTVAGTTTTTGPTTTTTIPQPAPELAGFSLGSYAVSIQMNCGVAALPATCLPATFLNGLLGSSVGITGIGYQGLAATSISLGGLLAANAGIGTLTSLLNSNFSGTSFGTIILNAVQYCQANNAGCNTGNNLAQFDANAMKVAFGGGAGSTIQLGRLFTNLGVGQGSSAGSATINLADLVFGGAILFDGNHAVSISNTGVNAGGATTSANLTAISPPAHYWGQVTPTSGPAPVSNTQVSGSMRMAFSPASIPNAANVVVNLPFALAQASGWLTGIDCSGGSTMAPTNFVVHATTSGATVGSPGGGTITLTVLGVAVTGVTTGASAANGSADLTFSPPYPGAPQTVSASTSVPVLTATLNLTGNVLVDGLLAGISTSLNSSLNAAVNPNLVALGQVAGVYVGGADVWADHVECRSPMLTN